MPSSNPFFKQFDSKHQATNWLQSPQDQSPQDVGKPAEKDNANTSLRPGTAYEHYLDDDDTIDCSCKQRLYHCCPHRINTNCRHHWYRQMYTEFYPCEYVTSPAYRIQPNLPTPPLLRFRRPWHIQAWDAVRYVGVTVARNLRILYLGRDAVQRKEDAERTAKREEYQRLRDRRIEEDEARVMEMIVSEGYCGLGVNMVKCLLDDEDGDDETDDDEEMRFASLDQVLMAPVSCADLLAVQCRMAFQMN